jgi:excinuclease UvrABC nuclease subunit
VLELAEYYLKEYHASVSRHPSGDPRINALSLIHGIDVVKTKAILQVYPKLIDVAVASVDQLTAADGIGPKLARRIWEFWRQE